MPLPDVTLIPVTASLAAVVVDDAAFTAATGATLGSVGPQAREVIEQTRAFQGRTGAPPEYGGFLGADTATMQVIGVCGFKGAPDARGDVEIAYGTFPPYEGKGYAKAMAAALIARARANGAPHIIAHTLPEHNASCSILRSLGFHQVGTVIADPEDGPVWRWELDEAAR